MPADPPDRLPQATIVPPKRARFSVIWIIPILAAVVAIGIAVQRILSQGPSSPRPRASKRTRPSSSTRM